MAAATSLPMVPRVRADCAPGGPLSVRPCPWNACRYHIERSGVCALDVVDERGSLVLAEIAELYALSRERVRQIERDALRKLRVAAERRGLVFEVLVAGWADRSRA